MPPTFCRRCRHLRPSPSKRTLSSCSSSPCPCSPCRPCWRRRRRCVQRGPRQRQQRQRLRQSGLRRQRQISILQVNLAVTCSGFFLPGVARDCVLFFWATGSRSQSHAGHLVSLALLLLLLLLDLGLDPYLGPDPDPYPDPCYAGRDALGKTGPLASGTSGARHRGLGRCCCCCDDDGASSRLSRGPYRDPHCGLWTFRTSCPPLCPSA
mmetsp:Transcript_47831/g.102481  ORF Transcript_47831/g.102481 Transcript_47831/m.102481 type:complete len:209 (-) Transcript_47831:185-811(-)